MEQVIAVQDIEDFGIKQGDVYDISRDYDSLPFIKKANRRCYVQKRLENGELNLIQKTDCEVVLVKIGLQSAYKKKKLKQFLEYHGFSFEKTEMTK